jgi:nucleotide-binding universal stress UspA family protein
MYRSILVPLDGSQFGEHALPLAATLARRAGARLTLAHIHEPAATLYGEGAIVLSEDLDRISRQQKRAYLESVQARLQFERHLVATRLLEGGVIEALVAQVAEEKTDLVVMTTHGRGPLGRFWLGSVADKLVRQLAVPLLLVHPAATAPDLSAERVIKHIMVPLDGSELAERVVAPATALGELMDSDYTLLRVVKPVHPTPPYTESMSLAQMAGEILDRIEMLQGEVRKEAQEYLNGVAGRLRARAFRLQTRIAVEEHPATAILHEAATHDADLIAIETHGRAGLSRLFLGSVADKVLRGSTIPILVQRPTS